MATVRMLAVALGAVCLMVHAKFVICGDPDGVIDFCVVDLPEEKGVWETGTEDDSTWDSPGYDPSKMGTSNFTAANSTVASGVLPCKDPATVDGEDFTFPGLSSAPNVMNALGSVGTPAMVQQFPALNTLGVSAARIDFAKDGVNPPHLHPRASELLYVIEGSVSVGFVDSTNKLFESSLEVGDLFVFPRGLVHFQKENAKGKAQAIAFFSSQNPGVVQIATSLLASDPRISDDVLEKSFNIDGKVLGALFHGVKSLSGSGYP